MLSIPLLRIHSHAPLIFVVAALASFFVAPAVASASLSWGAPVAVNTVGGQPTPAVACPSGSTTQCTAVDFGGNEVTFNPSNGNVTTTHQIDVNGLAGVACPLATQCTAVSFNGNETTFNPTSPGSPSPTGIAQSLSGVACPSTSRCTAVTGGGSEVTFDPTSPGGASPVQVFNFGGQAGGRSAVACPGTFYCVAASNSGQVVEIDTQTNPVGVTVDQVTGDPLHGVACASVMQCVTVDQLSNVLWARCPC
jgi:hypothetical protein